MKTTGQRSVESSGKEQQCQCLTSDAEGKRSYGGRGLVFWTHLQVYTHSVCWTILLASISILNAFWIRCTVRCVCLSATRKFVSDFLSIICTERTISVDKTPAVNHCRVRTWLVGIRIYEENKPCCLCHLPLIISNEMVGWLVLRMVYEVGVLVSVWIGCFRIHLSARRFLWFVVCLFLLLCLIGEVWSWFVGLLLLTVWMCG